MVMMITSQNEDNMAAVAYGSSDKHRNDSKDGSSGKHHIDSNNSRVTPDRDGFAASRDDDKAVARITVMSLNNQLACEIIFRQWQGPHQFAK